MRPENLQIALRPRSAWEAVELGTMLVRRHAGALWRPWLALTLPVFALLNALGWWFDQLWLACLLLWWLLPLFDRIPLYVLSRAVFGQPPGSIETLRAWPRGGPGYITAHLLWRRLSPWRALGLPVDLLEDGDHTGKQQRRALIMRGQRGAGLLLISLCQWFVLVVMLGSLSLVVLFVPGELMAQSTQVMAQTLFLDSPRWAQVLVNAVFWLALSLIEPFYIGAGFGLYLNRRVHLEGWDIELTLRRLRTRLGWAQALVACLALTVPLPLLAQDDIGRAHAAQNEHDETSTTLAAIFGPEHVADTRDFTRAVAEANQDPLLHRQQIQRVWVPNTQTQPDIPPPLSSAPNKSRLPERLGAALAGVGKALLWLLLAGLAVLLILTAPRWWPWMRRRRTRTRPREHTLIQTPEALPEMPLPAAISTRAQALWQAGDKRQALALLYRGSLQRLSGQTQIQRSATETECLHLSRQLPDPGQGNTLRWLIRVWMHAAYARRWPDDAEFSALGEALAQHFEWPR